MFKFLITYLSGLFETAEAALHKKIKTNKI